MSETVLSAAHLSRSFTLRGAEPIRAVDDVSLSVSAGQICGLVGPDGAGKTTTLRLILGAYQADAGTATIGGYRISEQPEKARALVGYLSQHFSLYEAGSI
jgi:ABC-2 type transport system ATP-binding protein